MARKHEAVEWLKKGYSPSNIARQMGVTLSTVMGYLYNQVGEGNIRRSDIVFSIDKNTRGAIERIISEKKAEYWSDIYREAERVGTPIDEEDLRVYLAQRDARVPLGDMYEMIRDIEVKLHSAVRNILVSQYGPNDWWRKGIPENIRADCAASLERDQIPASEPYCYTNFIDLKQILDKEWEIFSKALKLTSDKKKLKSDLQELNRIRNSVMHPVRATMPTDKDFDFVREFRQYHGL
jgi:predicted transcriptional regulator